MTDARWADVQDEIQRAMTHYSRAARLFDAGGLVPDSGCIDDLDLYRNQMALQHAMQSAHRTLEGGLTRILEIIGEEAPSGPNSHADLTARVSRPLDLAGRERPAILSPDVAADVDESRRFRHRAMHDYDNFDPAQALPAIESARRLQATLWPCIRAFRDLIDPSDASTALEALSPDIREIIRRLTLNTRKRGYVHLSDLDSALGPRGITAEMLENILRYFENEGIDVRQK